MLILFNLSETKLQKSETEMGIPSTMRDTWANRRYSPLIASPAEDQKILNSRRCTQEGVRAVMKAASIACVGSAVPTKIPNICGQYGNSRGARTKFHTGKSSGKVEEIELPVAQVDIIISEWMGYFFIVREYVKYSPLCS